MDFITCDFETYYSKDYSLSKMTTEAYVRSPEFEVIGVSVKVNDLPAVWYSGGDVPGFLAQFDWANAFVLCHNTVFDGAILRWRFGINAKFWLDTLSMAKPLHNVQVGNSLAALAAYYNLGEKGTEVVLAINKHRLDFAPSELDAYGAYCVNDVELTYKLFKAMKSKVPQSELMVIHHTLKMFIDPVLELDVPILQAHYDSEKARKLKLLTEVAGDSDPEIARKIIMSNAKLAGLLMALGTDVPMKLSKTTGRQTFAFSKTDKAFLALQEHDDPRVRTVVSARLGVKSSIEETRAENLLAVAARGSLPVMLNYYGAHTGRFSGGDKMNLQNLPRGGQLRQAIRAPRGKVLVACDSSQIEARVVAMLAGQKDLIEAFRQKRDIYSEFASEVYGRKIDRKNVAADKGPGFVGKTCILGLGYQMGADRFRRTLEIGNGYKPIFIDFGEASRIVGLYRAKYQRIAALWRTAHHAVSQMEKGLKGQISQYVAYDGPKIILPNGLAIQYPGLNAYRPATSSAFGSKYRFIGDGRTWREFLRRRTLGEDMEDLNWTDVYGGMVTENITQALARLVVSEQMLEIAKFYPVVLQVHDELVICVDEKEADTAKDIMVSVMSTAPKWMPDLPVACEAGVGYDYASCK